MACRLAQHSQQLENLQPIHHKPLLPRVTEYSGEGLQERGELPGRDQQSHSPLLEQLQAGFRRNGKGIAGKGKRLAERAVGFAEGEVRNFPQRVSKAPVHPRQRNFQIDFIGESMLGEAADRVQDKDEGGAVESCPLRGDVQKRAQGERETHSRFLTVLARSWPRT